MASGLEEWWGAGVVVCLEQGADLHMAQLMPLPLTVSCFTKIQIGFTFLVLAHLGSPGQRAVKRVCVCVCGHPGTGKGVERDHQQFLDLPLVQMMPVLQHGLWLCVPGTWISNVLSTRRQPATVTSVGKSSRGNSRRS